MNVKRLPVLQFKIPHKGRTYGAQCVFIDIFEIVFCRVPVGIEACAWMIFDDCLLYTSPSPRDTR